MATHARHAARARRRPPAPFERRRRVVAEQEAQPRVVAGAALLVERLEPIEPEAGARARADADLQRDRSPPAADRASPDRAAASRSRPPNRRPPADDWRRTTRSAAPPRSRGPTRASQSSSRCQNSRLKPQMMLSRHGANVVEVDDGRRRSTRARRRAPAPRAASCCASSAGSAWRRSMAISASGSGLPPVRRSSAGPSPGRGNWSCSESSRDGRAETGSSLASTAPCSTSDISDPVTRPVISLCGERWLFLGFLLCEM